MARDQNTVAKRLREMDRKRKAQEKRVRRQKRKAGGPDPVVVSDSGESGDAVEPDQPAPALNPPPAGNAIQPRGS